MIDPADRRASQAESDSPATGHPSLSRIAYLMVVQRGDHERYRFLRNTFDGKPVEVVFDRRQGDRRRQSEAPGQDRRRSDRRAAPPTSWVNLGFLVAKKSEA